MLNPNIQLKKWFYDTLTALGYDVYDGMAPDDSGKEYIIMDARTSGQEQGKSGYTNSCSVTLDIVTKNANFGYKRSEEISNDILTNINSDVIIDLGSGWNASSNYVDIRNLDGLNPLDNVFRTLLNYNLIITQTQ